MLRVNNLTKVILLFLTIDFVRCHNSEYMNPEWVDPHDWTVQKDPLQKLCPKSEPCKPCEITAKSEYLRLVNSLFNSNEFRFDESTNFLYRTVHIHITKEQLEKLKKMTDPIHIDGLVSEVLAQTEFGTIQLVKEYTVDVASNIWNHLPEWPPISEINFNALPSSRPILINFTLMVITYFLCRRYRINYLLILFFVLVYCLYEYLDNECHRRIELNEAVDFIYGKQKNPCMSPTKMNWLDWAVGRDSKSACRDFLEKQSTHKTQCGVIDLFHEFISQIVYKQLVLFFTTIADLVRSISTTNGVLITAVTLYFMKGLLVPIITSTFRYILNPSVWSHVAADISKIQTQEEAPVQRVQTVTDSDIRDIHLSKALDLANQQVQLQLILEQRRIEMANMPSSGVELLRIAGDDEKNESEEEVILSTSVEKLNENQLKNDVQPKQQSTPSSSSSDEFKEFIDNEINITQNGSIVTINDSHPFLISESSSEYSERNSTEGANSTKLSEKSNSTSMTSNSMKSMGDSVEILSISSDTPAQ